MSQLGSNNHHSKIGHTDEFNRQVDRSSRNENESICLIVNPKAGAGSAGSNLGALKQAADRAFKNWEIRLTEGPRHGVELAEAASGEDFDIIAAVGGDGTCHEVINGMMCDDRARNKKQAFAVIPFGTGSDLIKSLGVPNHLREALWIAATGMSLPTDVGKAVLSTDSGQISRYFINVAGFGANGEVVRRANQSSKRLGGRLTFLKATLQTALSYTPAAIKLICETDAEQMQWEGPLMSAFIANGSYCGGGMWVGRGGTMHDGKLDLRLLRPMSLSTQLIQSRRLYDGKFERIPDSQSHQVSEVHATARANDTVLVDLDGELSGRLPGHFQVLPRALQVRGRWSVNPID